MLITARHALEQNRDVFVIPANIGTDSEGSNALLRTGARPITSAEDLLEDYSGRTYERVSVKKQEKEETHKLQTAASPLSGAQFSEQARAVYAALGKDPITIGELSSAVKIAVPQILQALTELEMEGKVRSYAGRRYVRVETA